MLKNMGINPQAVGRLLNLVKVVKVSGNQGINSNLGTTIPVKKAIIEMENTWKYHRVFCEEAILFPVSKPEDHTADVGQHKIIGLEKRSLKQVNQSMVAAQ